MRARYAMLPCWLLLVWYFQSLTHLALVTLHVKPPGIRQHQLLAHGLTRSLTRYSNLQEFQERLLTFLRNAEIVRKRNAYLCKHGKKVCF